MGDFITSLDIAIIAVAVALLLVVISEALHDTLAELRNIRRLQCEIEALRRERLAAERYNEAQQHREPGEEWKDWA